jgi:trimeric autotransporter adhesin
MSTKTNFKRVALVAVAALGLGVLTSVAPASAGANANTVFSATTGNNPLQCANTTTAGSEVITLPLSAGVVISAGVNMEASDIVSVGGSGLAVTGFTASGVTHRTDAIAADRSRLTSTAAALTTPALPLTITLTAAAAGTYYVTVTEQDGGAATVTAVETITVKFVAACGNNALSLADSFIEVSSLANADDNIDETANLTVANGSTTYINLALRDAYLQPLSGTGVLLATATNGAVIAWDGAPTTQSSTAIATGRGAAGTELYVTQGTANAYKPLVTVVTITLDGAPVTTKTITFTGIAASIAVRSIEIGKKNTANTLAFKYDVKDSAGNLLAGYTPTAVASTVPSNGVVSAISTAGSSLASSTSPQTGGFTCLDVSGTGKVQLELTNDIGAKVTSPVYDFTCGGDIYGYSASMDKASYAPGEVATLTIRGTDSKGGKVFDAVTSAGAVVSNAIGAISIAAPGLTAVTTPTSTDTFVGGSIVYRFTVGSTEGSFTAVVAATDIDDPVTISYSVKSSSTAVSNADVLKAIVSLIASINKQIAALQKALLKR